MNNNCRRKTVIKTARQHLRNGKGMVFQGVLYSVINLENLIWSKQSYWEQPSIHDGRQLRLKDSSQSGE